jgi:multiple sugar transport system permease protein
MVTAPLRTPTARNLVMPAQKSKAVGLPALVVTEGGPPDYATTYLPLFVYREAFEYLRYGYAAAATLVVLVLTVPIVWLQWRIVRRLRARV